MAPASTSDKKRRIRRLPSGRQYAIVAAWTVAAITTAWTAIVAKEAGRRPPVLAEVRMPQAPVARVATRNAVVAPAIWAVGAPDPEPALQAETEEYPAEVAAFARDPHVRWFNGRPVRPTRELTMVVTAYSPDERSCGESADGITATLHSVETNDFCLVAADPALLRYGSMLTIPGYDEGRIVPVLDCGGAIKGHRLDVLYPTHEKAREWGRRKLKVVVWEYADGLPAENPRRER